MNDFKAYASRGLNDAGFDNRERKRWTRHGSTRKLWTWEAVEAAIHYVVREQGEPMAVWEDLYAIVRLEEQLEAAARITAPASNGAATVRERGVADEEATLE